MKLFTTLWMFTRLRFAYCKQFRGRQTLGEQTNRFINVYELGHVEIGRFACIAMQVISNVTLL